MSKLDEVAKMLSHFDDRKWDDNPDKTTNFGNAFCSKDHYRNRAKEICQLFEPKPDELDLTSDTIEKWKAGDRKPHGLKTLLIRYKGSRE